MLLPMRKTGITFAAAAVALLLAGCTSPAQPPAPTATPEPTVAAAAHCEEFAELTDRTADAVIAAWQEDAGDTAFAELEALPGKFDMLALSADGNVGERIGAVADMLLEEDLMILSLNPDSYFDALRSVQRACEAEGSSIGVATWSS